MSLHDQIRHRAHLVYRPYQIVEGIGIQWQPGLIVCPCDGGEPGRRMLQAVRWFGSYAHAHIDALTRYAARLCFIVHRGQENSKAGAVSGRTLHLYVASVTSHE